MSTSDRRRIVPPSTPMKITQIAVVVRDMDTALKSYTETLGWGPWSVFDYKPPLLHDTRVRGEAVEYRMIGAETSVDGLGFELIQPVSGPSIYQEFLDSHGEGVQHIACMKHSYEDSSLVREHWHSNGAEERQDRRLDRVLLPGHRPDAQVRARIRQWSRYRPQAELGAWNNDYPPAGDGKAGLHVDTIRWMHQRRIAAFLPDGDGETVPSNVEGVLYPIHPLQVTAMGMFAADSLQIEDLAAACEQEGRFQFMVVGLPLRLPGGTGSPWNPIAIF